MLRFIDSFQHYSTSQLARKWNDHANTLYVSIQSSGGRSNGPCLRLQNGVAAFYYPVSITFDYQQTWIVGFRFKYTGATQDVGDVGYLLKFVENAVTHVQIALDNRGIIYAYRDTTALVSSGIAKALRRDIEYYIEVKVYIHDSSGTVDVRVNGESWISYTGDTRNASNAYANVIVFGGLLAPASGTIYNYISDVYIADAQAGNVTDFIGDCRVDDLYFTADGYSSQFTPSTGSNYQNVDDNPADDDTTYNESSTAGHIDSYSTTSMGFTPSTIYGAQAVYTLRKDDAGARSFKRNIRKGGVNYQSSAAYLGVGYGMYREIIEDDPATATNWVQSDLEANVEWGLEVV